MGGFGSGDYFRDKKAKPRVDWYFSVDSFELARRAPQLQRSGICFDHERLDDKAPNATGLSILVLRAKGGYMLWVGQLDAELDAPAFWSALIKDFHTQDVRASDLAPAMLAWSQGKACQFPFLTVFPLQHVTRVTTRNSVDATCQWFLCPAPKGGNPQSGETCSKRCRKLYFRNGHFACRACHGLAYRSQRRDAAERLPDKADRIRIKALGRLSEEERAGYRDHFLSFPPPAATMTHGEYDAMEAMWDDCRRRGGWMIVDKAKKQSEKILKE